MILILLFFLLGSGAQAAELHLDRIHLPPGFKISVFTDQVPNARAMALSPKGTLFVGTFEEGKVYAIPNAASLPQTPRVLTLAHGLRMPVGVAFKDGSLYVSAVDRILRFDGIEDHLENVPKPVVVSRDFPSDTHHGWKFIAFGPDGWLYVPVGGPCNVCVKTNPHYASIMRMKPDGSELQVYASGVRNTVGFDWNPLDGTLWFTDNGRDLLGNHLPPDELNHAPRPGMNFGFPYCLGNGQPDPDFGKGKDCSQFTSPVQQLEAHTASLGMRFYRGEKMFPSEFRNQIFIAEHGSWNRDPPFGYRVTRVRLLGDKSMQYAPFAEGWLGADGKPWGRPVDVQELPDGSLLVSDDFAGVIYRISYGPRF